MVDSVLKRTIVLFVTFLFRLNNVTCSTKQYFGGHVKVECLENHVNLWIHESYANKIETEGTPTRLMLKKSLKNNVICVGSKGSDGFYHLEVQMTPGHHECADNYQELEAGTLYNFVAGFDIKIPNNRMRKKSPPIIEFACMQQGTVNIPDVTFNNKEIKTGLNVIETGINDLELHMFKDPDHKNEYTVSALGEFPLKEGKVYIQYKTSADMDLEVHSCLLAADEQFYKSITFIEMQCPNGQLNATIPENKKQKNGETTATFSFDPTNFVNWLGKNLEMGYFKCVIVMTERNSQTHSAEITKCRRKRMADFRKKRSAEKKVLRHRFAKL